MHKVAGGNRKVRSAHLGDNKGGYVGKGYPLLHKGDGVLALENFENLCVLRCIC